MLNVEVHSEFNSAFSTQHSELQVSVLCRRSRPDDRPPSKAGGKSELRWAVRRVTPGQGNLKESGTENIPPAQAGKGEKVR
jgi:hypothetical protein